MAAQVMEGRERRLADDVHRDDARNIIREKQARRRSEDAREIINEIREKSIDAREIIEAKKREAEVEGPRRQDLPEPSKQGSSRTEGGGRKNRDKEISKTLE